MPEGNIGNQLVLYEQEDPLQDDFEDFNFDVNVVLDEIEQNVAISQVDTGNNKSTKLQCTNNKKISPKIPIFSNCKIGSIGNIHFHIHKNCKHEKLESLRTVKFQSEKQLFSVKKLFLKEYLLKICL